MNVGPWAWLGHERGWSKLAPPRKDGISDYGYLCSLDSPPRVCSLSGFSIFEYTGSLLTDVISSREYNKSNDAWEDITWDSPDLVPRWRIGSAKAMLGNRIIVAGGYEDDEPGPKRYEFIPKSSAFVLDLDTGDCEWLDDMPLPAHDINETRANPMRSHCAGCLTHDGSRFVVSGGVAMHPHVQFDDEDSDDENMNWSTRRSCLAWSFASGRWEHMPPMTTPRSHHKLLAAGGHLVALGGGVATSSGCDTCENSSAELFDEAASRWLKLPIKTLPQGVPVCM